MGFGAPLTTTEAGRIAGTTGETVRSWIVSGELAGTRCGAGIWLIERGDLERFLARRGPGPAVNQRRRRPPAGPQLVAAALLTLQGEPATPEELGLLVGRHPGNVRKHLLILAAAGHAERNDHSWTLTRAGEAAYSSTEVAA